MLIQHSSIVLANNQPTLVLSDAQVALVDYSCLYWPEHYKTCAAKVEDPSNPQGFPIFGRDEACDFWAREYKRAGTLTAKGHTLDTRLKVVCYFGLDDLLNDSLVLAKSTV
ncbi:hypothetical protein J3459_012362 [Metarhizium acridum]|nr:hypothetical protein J3459_012362 [Metarhizium acridum]